MSSKYAELHEVQATSNEETGASSASFGLPLPGEVLSREGIIRRCGLFNFSELIHATTVQADQSGDVQTFTVYFEDDVYYSGTNGYGADWMATNGIAAEFLCDLDGDDADEYMIFYVRSDISEYGYIDNRWTAAIVEPVSGGYVFSDSFRFGFNWEHVGEYSILLVNGKNGMRIVDGSIGYWDDEGGGIFSTFLDMTAARSI